MKITFNPTIKNHKTYFKPTSLNTLKPENNQNLDGLNCVVNYNLAFCSRKRAVYAINYDGSYERFDSIAQAAKGESYEAIKQVLSGRNNSGNNRVYIYADEVEKDNIAIMPDVINNALLNFRNADNQPIYAIDFQGNMQRFDSVANAVEVLRIDKDMISKVLRHTKKTSRGYVFIRAFDVELRDKNGKLLKGEDNKTIVDMKKINELRARFLDKGKDFPIVSIDKNGNVEQYQDITQAIKHFETKRINIQQSIMSNRIFQTNYVFTRLADVVQIDEFGDVVFDENNDFVIDYDKVEKLRQMAFREK